MATILVADGDLGFVAWLGTMLAAGGYATFPATSASTAKQLVDELQIKVDVAIVNLALSGIIELIDEFRLQDASLKIIAIEDAPPVARIVKVDAAHSRSEIDWQAAVRRVLELHKATGTS